MRFAVVLLLGGAAAAACGESSTMPDSQVPLTFPMRIVVSAGAVQVYMEAADLGGCACSAVIFPSVGSCSFLTDAGPCSGNPYCRSCITDFGVEVNGVRLTPTGDGGNDPWTRYYGTIPNGQLSLVLAGCGHPPTRISLDGPAFPRVTVAADYVNGAPHVSWITDAVPLSTLLTLYGGSHGDLCHVQDGSDYTFAGWMYASAVAVQPLGSRMDVDTEFGPATIWRSGAASAMFPTP